MLTRIVQALLSVAAVVNVADVAGADELVVWLIRGSLSAALLLLVWLFNQGVAQMKELRVDVDELDREQIRIKSHLGLDDRLDDRGITARRRRAPLSPTED